MFDFKTTNQNRFETVCTVHYLEVLLAHSFKINGTLFKLPLRILLIKFGFLTQNKKKVVVTT